MAIRVTKETEEVEAYNKLTFIAEDETVLGIKAVLKFKDDQKKDLVKQIKDRMDKRLTFHNLLGPEIRKKMALVFAKDKDFVWKELNKTGDFGAALEGAFLRETGLDKYVPKQKTIDEAKEEKKARAKKREKKQANGGESVET
jgi:hypothetical protein